MTYHDTAGREWDTAQEALDEFVSDLPDLTEEETELAFQFTRHSDTPETNLAALAYGIVYAGLADKFEHHPVPQRKAEA